MDMLVENKIEQGRMAPSYLSANLPFELRTWMTSFSILYGAILKHKVDSAQAPAANLK